MERVAGDKIGATLSLSMDSFRIQIPVLPNFQFFVYRFHGNIDSLNKEPHNTKLQSIFNDWFNFYINPIKGRLLKS